MVIVSFTVPGFPGSLSTRAQGIVFDTDVDRSAIVDRNGSEINSNRFIALMSAIILREHPGTTVVTDSVTRCVAAQLAFAWCGAGVGLAGWGVLCRR